MSFLEFAGTVFLSSGGVGALLWVFRSTFTHWLFEELLKERNRHEAALQIKAHEHEKALEVELEKLKSELRRTSDHEIEEVKSRLSLERSQQSVVFTKLHERRVEAIVDVYKALESFHKELGRLIAPFQSVDFDAQKQTEKLVKSLEVVEAVVVSVRLFLPRHVVARVTDLQQTCVSIANDFNIVVRADSKRPDVLRWHQLTKKFDSDVRTTMETLEEEMRVALGDEPTEKTSLSQDAEKTPSTGSGLA